ncbi:MAG: hypothetical protein ACJAVI_005669 [Candidatus Azotimanducaceae bacterium]|jgi:hypothetical protein
MDILSHNDSFQSIIRRTRIEVRSLLSPGLMSYNQSSNWSQANHQELCVIAAGCNLTALPMCSLDLIEVSDPVDQE